MKRLGASVFSVLPTLFLACGGSEFIEGDPGATVRLSYGALVTLRFGDLAPARYVRTLLTVAPAQPATTLPLTYTYTACQATAPPVWCLAPNGVNAVDTTVPIPSLSFSVAAGTLSVTSMLVCSVTPIIQATACDLATDTLDATGSSFATGASSLTLPAGKSTDVGLRVRLNTLVPTGITEFLK